MTIRGIRGAITVDLNDPEEIVSASKELLQAIVNRNPSLNVDDLASVWFTSTRDLNTAYPARAAREMGWVDLPMMCVQEMAVEGSISKCIRVLLHWNTPLSPKEIRHVYLRDAASLRPDWAERDAQRNNSGGAL